MFNMHIIKIIFNFKQIYRYDVQCVRYHKTLLFYIDEVGITNTRYYLTCPWAIGQWSVTEVLKS